MPLKQTMKFENQFARMGEGIQVGVNTMIKNSSSGLFTIVPCLKEATFKKASIFKHAMLTHNSEEHFSMRKMKYRRKTGEISPKHRLSVVRKERL